MKNKLVENNEMLNKRALDINNSAKFLASLLIFINYIIDFVLKVGMIFLISKFLAILS